MKKALRLNRFIFFCLCILALAHLATLFGFLPYEILWDTTIKDRASLIISEGIALAAFCIVMPLYRLVFTRSKTRRAHTITIVIQRVLIVYFALEILGAFRGVTLLYKLTNITVYSILLLVTVRATFQNAKLRRRFRSGRRPNNYVA